MTDHNLFIRYDGAGLAMKRGLVLVEAFLAYEELIIQTTKYANYRSPGMQDLSSLPEISVSVVDELPELYKHIAAMMLPIIYANKVKSNIKTYTNLPFLDIHNWRFKGAPCEFTTYSLGALPKDTAITIFRAIKVCFARWGMNIPMLDVSVFAAPGVGELGSNNRIILDGIPELPHIFLNTANSITEDARFGTMAHELCHIAYDKPDVPRDLAHDSNFCAMLSMVNPDAIAYKKCRFGTTKDELDQLFPYYIATTAVSWKPDAGYFFLVPTRVETDKDGEVVDRGAEEEWYWVPRRDGLWNPVRGLWTSAERSKLKAAFGRANLKRVQVERLYSTSSMTRNRESLADIL